MLHAEQPSKVEFENFMPSEDAVASMNATLSWLMAVMPSAATVSASLRRIGAKYLCKVDVISSIGCFRREAFDSLSRDAVDRAVSDVRLAAKSWQKVRIGLDGTSFIELMTQ